MSDFAGKTVVITGAAGGIGQVLCRHFAGLGARIGALDKNGAALEQLCQGLRGDGAAVNSIVLSAFEKPPGSFAEVITRYGDLFRDIDARWKSELEAAKTADAEPPTGLADPPAESLRRVLQAQSIS